MANRARIHESLQEVFLASLGGKVAESITAPPERVGFKTFVRDISLQHINEAPTRCIEHVSLSSMAVNIDTDGTAADATKALLQANGGSRCVSKPLDGSPQSYFDSALEARGYSSETFPTLESGYYYKPNPLQLASYGTFVTRTIRNSDSKILHCLLQCGISPNACNKFGESIIHSVSRRGDYDLLQVLLHYGCSLQISDDYGRTPLHDACWQADPCFETVRLILANDKNLLYMTDIRGATPLSYVKKENHSKWISFLSSIIDQLWPMGTLDQSPPSLAMQKPNSRPLPTTRSVLSLEDISILANNQSEPDEKALLHQYHKLFSAAFKVPEDDELLSETSVESDSSYDSDCESYDSLDFDFDVNDLRQMLIIARSRPERVLVETPKILIE